MAIELPPDEPDEANQADWAWATPLAEGLGAEWTPAERAALEIQRLRYELHLLHEETLDHLRLAFARWLYTRKRLSEWPQPEPNGPDPDQPPAPRAP